VVAAALTAVDAGVVAAAGVVAGAVVVVAGFDMQLFE